jgi:hypothetical protein
MRVLNCSICSHAITFPVQLCENYHALHKSCLKNLKCPQCPICSTRYFPLHLQDADTLKAVKCPTNREIEAILSVHPEEIAHISLKHENFFKFALLSVQSCADTIGLVDASYKRYSELSVAAMISNVSAIQHIVNPSQEMRDHALLFDQDLLTILPKPLKFNDLKTLCSQKKNLNMSTLRYFFDNFTASTNEEMYMAKFVSISKDYTSVQLFDVDETLGRFALFQSLESVAHFRNFPYELCLYLFDHHRILFARFCVPVIKDMPMIIQRLIEHDCSSIFFFQNVKEYCLYALQHNLSSIRFIFTYDFDMYALRRDGLMLRFVKKQTFAKCLKAIRQNWRAARYIDAKLCAQSNLFCRQIVRVNASKIYPILFEKMMSKNISFILDLAKEIQEREGPNWLHLLPRDLKNYIKFYFNY